MYKRQDQELAEKLYNDTLKHYHDKNDRLKSTILPVLKNIHKTRGATVEDILIPFSDGTKQIGVVSNLEKSIDTNGREVIKSMEKMIALGIIDQSWKEHLREMDDLKQSVQNAVYEQKDPLLIYKFEAFELFKRFIAKVNEETVAFLTRSEVPQQEPDDLREAKQQRSKENYKESKEESKSLLNARDGSRAPVERSAPVKSEKIHGRNDRVSVQYTDGTLKENVKFKTVEEDVKSNKGVIIE